VALPLGAVLAGVEAVVVSLGGPLILGACSSPHHGRENSASLLMVQPLVLDVLQAARSDLAWAPPWVWDSE